MNNVIETKKKQPTRNKPFGHFGSLDSVRYYIWLSQTSRSQQVGNNVNVYFFFLVMRCC